MIMKTLLLLLFVTFCALLPGGCRSGQDTLPTVTAPDYADTIYWFQGSRLTTDKPTDVFYVVPTCTWDWQDSSGNIHHHMNPLDSVQRALVAPSILLGKNVFAGESNFFAPYYRQITMESWMHGEELINKRYPVALSDIVAAFDYYLAHYNGGRPFILAGHSQGAKAVIDLLREHLTPETARLLVAAYPIGYAITDNDLRDAPYLIPARDSVDTGVTICFNSVSDTSAICPLFRGNRVCINPLNWRTDATPAPASGNPGSVFLTPSGEILEETPCMVGTRIDTLRHVLITDGVDPDRYFIPSISAIFPRGNYHVQELNFYFRSLQHNVRGRIKAYRETYTPGPFIICDL